MLDRIHAIRPSDAIRVAAYVRQYMRELRDRGVLADDDYESYTAVLRLWHEEYRLPWLDDGDAAFHVMMSDKE